MKKIKVLAVVLNFTILSFAQSGSYIDTSFAVNGVSDISVTTLIMENQEYHGFSTTGAGKIVNLAGGFNEVDDLVTLVAQYNSDGTVDTDFGTNGVLEWEGLLGYDIISNTSNNLYIAGISLTSGKLTILGLDSTGSILTSFGTNGIADIDENTGSIGYVIAMDDADRFIVGGKAVINGEEQLILARFTGNGVVDASFGTNGVLKVDVSKVVTDEELFINNLSLFPDNSILVAGNVYTPEDGVVTGDYQYNELAIKINASGGLDNSFGDNGVSIFYDVTASGADIYASYVLSDNKVLLSISGLDNASNSINGLLRLNTDGTIDPSFGTSGLLTLINNDYVIDELFETSADNGILALGGEFGNSGVSVLKINENGIIDTDFANDGVLPIDFPGVPSTDLISNAIELPDGKILVSGFREAEDGFLMGRYFTEDQQLSIAEETFIPSYLYPNPAYNSITISSNQDIDSFRVYGIDGKLVLEKSFKSGKTNLDVSSLQNGIYIVRILDKNKNIKEIIKFIKS